MDFVDSFNQTTILSLKYYQKFRIIHQILVRITMPYIFIVGLTGLVTNSFTILLLSTSCVTKNLKHKWTLISLAGSDLILNIALLIRVIHDLSGSKIHRICIIISFLSHFAELLSALFIVLFTIQRYSAVRHPLQAAVQRSSTPIIPLITIIFFSFTFCFALSHWNLYIECHEELKLFWFIADALISFVIPFSLILIFNILIINLIRHHARSPLTEPISFVQYYRTRSKFLRQTSQPSISRAESYSVTWSNGPSNRTRMTETDFETMRRDKHGNRKSADSSAFPLSDETQPGDLSATTSLLDQTPTHPTPSGTHPFSTPDLVRLGKNSVRFERLFSTESLIIDALPRSTSERDFISNRYRQTAQSIRVTRMLVLVSTCFLLLNAPAHLCVIASKLYTLKDSPVYDDHHELTNFKQSTNLTDDQLTNFVYIETKHDVLSSLEDQMTIHVYYIAVVVTQWISYASYSLNFFLYSLSGVTFRTSLRQLINKISWFRF